MIGNVTPKLSRLLAVLLLVATIPAPAAPKPAAAPAPAKETDTPNPWVEKMLAGYPWAKAVGIKDQMDRRNAVHELAHQWVTKKAINNTKGTMTAAFTGVTDGPAKGGGVEVIALFDCRGKLPDGAPYYCTARVPVAAAKDRDDADRRKTRVPYKVGTLYDITGPVRSGSIGQEVPPANSPRKGEVSVRLEVNFDSATLKEAPRH